MQSAFQQKPCFSSIASCLTTGMHFQTNGFKASRLVSQPAIVLKPMVLRHLVQSHKFRLQKNQWLMWCFAVSRLNRFLKPMVLRSSVASSGVSQLVFVLQPMVLRPLVADHNWHARLTSQSLLKTNGFKASGRAPGETPSILHGNCMATALQMHSKCVATAWQLHGNCMATAWQLCVEPRCG